MAAGRRTLGSALLILVLAILVWLLYGALASQLSVGCHLSLSQPFCASEFAVEQVGQCLSLERRFQPETSC